MRVLLNEEHVIDAADICGSAIEGNYYVHIIDYNDNLDRYVYDDSVSLEEAEERWKKIVKESFETGKIDCSNEPLVFID